MRAKELQVGDYVNYRGKIIKVTSLYDKGGSNEVGWGIKEDTWVNAINIEPIPLTPEILEKNGLHLYNRKTNSLLEQCNHSDCFEEDEDFRVELSLDNDGSIRWTINGDEYTIMPLNYVHQLQHALRLCGIEKEIEL